MAPHYVHMFEGLFSRPRPWQFGHLYLPGGSRNLGASSFELSSGSRAPLIGTLAQVTRAVRLRDGKFLILATAVSRFKVNTTIAVCLVGSPQLWLCITSVCGHNCFSRELLAADTLCLHLRLLLLSSLAMIAGCCSCTNLSLSMMPGDSAPWWWTIQDDHQQLYC